MITVTLNSSALATADYWEDTERLRVTFRNGRSYDHYNVPKGIFEALRDAPSAGTYYNAAIKGIYG